jgi:hypothetical protein
MNTEDDEFKRIEREARGIPDAIHHTDPAESLEYITGWNDCRQAMLAAQQEPVAWGPYLSDRADGVSGHYAIARWNPRGYREVWNLRRHAWGAYSDDVLSLEEADTLLRLIEIPTRKVETPQPAQRKPLTDEQIDAEFDVFASGYDCESNEYLNMGSGEYFRAGFKAAYGIKENT